MNRPVIPAKATLPERCDAAPVEEVGGAEPEGEAAEVPFSVRLPPVPAVDEGETLLEARAELFLKAAKVLSPD